VHHDLSSQRPTPPIGTVTSAATAIYSPPRDGFPFSAVVFSPSGMVEAFRPFPTRGGAAAFLQAFLQEGAGEYGFSDRSG
jgi:hypothetical protein